MRVYISTHAEERYAETYGDATWRQMRRTIADGERLSPELVMQICGRHRPDHTAVYVLGPDARGIWVIKNGRVAKTFLRMSQSQQDVLRRDGA